MVEQEGHTEMSWGRGGGALYIYIYKRLNRPYAETSQVLYIYIYILFSVSLVYF